MRRWSKGVRCGLTYVEVLVLIGIVALIISIVLPILNNAKQCSGRVPCASNLRQIGQGLMLYANDHKGAYPQTRYIPGAPLTKFTGAAAANPFADNGPSPNDVTAAMFLLIRYCDIDPKTFIHPDSDDQRPDKLGGLPANKRSNFSGPINFGYSFALPYPDDAAVKMGYKLNSGVVVGFVIGADRNQSKNRYAAMKWDEAATQQMKEMNSRNHEGEGQNVLFNDGHVEWCTSPFVGANHDNIYTRNGASSGDPMTHQPENPLDTILLPTEP